MINSDIPILANRIKKNPKRRIRLRIPGKHWKLFPIKLLVVQYRLFQMWRLVETADESLREMKRYHSQQQKDFKERWAKISQGREAIELNKKKFRHFIREGNLSFIIIDPFL